MYKISEFSKITNLTTKALRYYDEQGILKPSFRAENSYRYYSQDDYEKARLISLLRKLDFSIAEIKDTLAHYDGKDDLSYYLQEKQQMIEKQIKKERELIRTISFHLDEQEKEEISMKYQIETKRIPAVTVSSIRYKGKYQDTGKYIGTLYKEIKSQAAGAPFNCYYDDDYKEIADIELCIPTKGIVQGKETVSKQLPAITALCTTHIGSYDKLNEAYKALLDYAGSHGITCLTPSRELYRKGPGMIFKGNPNKYETELMIPIKEENHG